MYVLLLLFVWYLNKGQISFKTFYFFDIFNFFIWRGEERFQHSYIFFSSNLLHIHNINVSNSFRWHNHLNPDIRKDAWTLDEELALMNAHRAHGNKWAEIAKVLPGRYFLLVLIHFISHD